MPSLMDQLDILLDSNNLLLDAPPNPNVEIPLHSTPPISPNEPILSPRKPSFTNTETEDTPEEQQNEQHQHQKLSAKRKMQDATYPPSKRNKVTEGLTAVPSPLLDYVKHMQAVLCKNFPKVSTRDAEHIVQEALKKISFPTVTTDGTAVTLQVNANIEKYEDNIAEMIVAEIDFEKTQNLLALAKGQRPAQYLRKLANRIDLIQTKVIANRQSAQDWPPTQIKPELPDESEIFNTRTFIETVLMKTGAKYTTKETSNIYRRLAHKVWNYEPWRPRAIKDIQVPSKIQIFALHAFIHHAMHKDEVERILIKHGAKLIGNIIPKLAGQDREDLKQIESAITQLQRLHMDFEYKLLNIDAITCSNYRMQDTSKRARIRALLNDIHRSMYYANPKKRDELPPRIPPKAEDTITKLIHEEWMDKDLTNLKTQKSRHSKKQRGKKLVDMMQPRHHNHNRRNPSNTWKSNPRGRNRQGRRGQGRRGNQRKRHQDSSRGRGRGRVHSIRPYNHNATRGRGRRTNDRNQPTKN